MRVIAITQTETKRGDIKKEKEMNIDPRVKKIRKGLYVFRGKTIRRDYAVFIGQSGAWYTEVRGRSCHEATLKSLVAYMDRNMGPQRRKMTHRVN